MLHGDNLFLIIRVVTYMYIVFDQGWPYLLVFASDQHRRDTHKLEIFLGNLDLFQVAINQVDCQKQTLHLQFELEVDLNDPVDKYATHSFGDMVLVVHILDLRLIILLGVHEVLHNISCKFAYILHVSGVFSVTGLNGFGHVDFAAIFKLISDRFQIIGKSLALLHLFSFQLFCLSQLV